MQVTDIPSAEILPYQRAKKRVDVGSIISILVPGTRWALQAFPPIGFEIGDRLFLSAWYSKEDLG